MVDNKKKNKSGQNYIVLILLYSSHNLPYISAKIAAVSPVHKRIKK